MAAPYALPAVQATPTPAAVATCPSGKKWLVAVTVANKDNANPALFTLWWTDDSAADAVGELSGDDQSIPASDSFAGVFTKVLEAGDAIWISSGSSGDIVASADVYKEWDA